LLNTHNTTVTLTAFGFELGDVSLKFVEVVHAVIAYANRADFAGFNGFNQLCKT
jgi:hypothetical protein